LPRANNVSIFLKKLSKVLTCDQLCLAVRRMEAAILEPDLLEAILANLPGETEAQLLRDLQVDDAAQLSPPERFSFEMARLPRLRPRLQALRLRHSLPANLHRASSALTAVADAVRQLMGSSAFVRILASILAHGNFLNAGTPRGGAKGVKLEGLEKARSVRSTDGKQTLLEYACRASGVSRSTISSELGGLRSACRLPLLEIVRIVEEIEQGINDVRKELALCPLPDLDAEVALEAASGTVGSGAERSAALGGLEDENNMALRFRIAMTPFYDDMLKAFDELAGTRDDTKVLLKRLASWLGEDPASADADALLKACADLVETAEACAAADPPLARTGAKMEPAGDLYSNAAGDDYF